MERAAEVGAADEGDERGGCRFPNLRPDLLGDGSVGHAVQVVDVGHDPPHWEGVGNIPTQLGLQADGEATAVRKGRRMSIPPADGRNGGGRTAGGGYLCLPPP